MNCTRCDQPNADGNTFCTACGAALAPAIAPAGVAPVAPAPSMPTAAGIAPAPLIATAPSAVAPAGMAFAPQVNVNVTTQAAPATPVVVVASQPSGPGCLVRALYFVFIGVWFGALWTGLAWALLVSIIGLPLGIMMLNRIPQVTTLRPPRTATNVTMQGGAVVVSQGALPQQPFAVRAAYFLLVGWWFSALWLGVAWGLIGATLGLALPISFWMFDRTPAIVTLARS